jgi:hypothetical protein
VFEVTFNAFAIERVFRFAQNDRIDDIMAGNLGGPKCLSFRKVNVGHFTSRSPEITLVHPFHDHAFWPDGCAALRGARRPSGALPRPFCGILPPLGVAARRTPRRFRAHPKRLTISSMAQAWPGSPASIASVTRSVGCTRPTSQYMKYRLRIAGVVLYMSRRLTG